MKEQIEVITADFKKKEHCEAFISLINEYRSGPMGDGMLFDKTASERLIKEVNKHPSTVIYFAVSGGKIVGCATCFIGFSTFRAKHLINIHDLIVTRNYRRKGVGRKLLEYIENEGKKNNMCKITLEVRIDNSPALKLYYESGFYLGSQPMYFLSKYIE